MTNLVATIVNCLDALKRGRGLILIGGGLIVASASAAASSNGSGQPALPPGSAISHGPNAATNLPAGMAKSDWANIRAAYEAGRHAFTPVAGGWQARNPGQQWATKFDGRSFLTEPRHRGWQWGLELKAYGFAGARRTISSAPEVQATGQRLTYDWDATVQEWFVNDQRGLEHGYIVSQRPPGAGSAPLAFELAVRGTLQAQVAADGRGVQFCDPAGSAVLNYSGLKVWDADGKMLSSRFIAGPATAAAAGATIVLLVEEQHARYPITIDPLAQQAYLKASNTPSDVGTNDLFGFFVAVDGDTAVIGADLEDGSTAGVNSLHDNAAVDSGAAYVFVRSGTNWTQQAYLKASNPGAGDRFGHAVTISGDTIVVGAYLEDSSTTGINSTPNNSAADAGAAYVFVRSGTNWTQQAYLKASNTGADFRFGVAVALSGDTLIVGSHAEDSGTTGINSTPNTSALDAGAAYVFVRSGTNWTQQAYLKASNTGAGDLFGLIVAASGDTVVVGAPREDSHAAGINGPINNNSTDAGMVYVFVRSGVTWTQQAYLKANNPGNNSAGGDNFGYSVAISGDTVVVGAYGEDSSTTGINNTWNEGAAEAGAAYVFVRSGVTWTEQAFLKASNTGVGDQFGFAVTVSGDTAVVGAYLEDSSSTGINSTPNEGAINSGAAYVFVRSGTTWTQQAYLKASNAGAGDQFGFSVALSGDKLMVSANLEDSSTPGVNSIPDEIGTDSGASYAFGRTGATWSQEAYVKSGNNGGTNSIDAFGWSVAIAGDTAVVGALREDSSTDGVNSTPDESATDAGAAYVFARNGATWSQQAYLKASDSAAGDLFGYSVSISGDTIVVGAAQDDNDGSGLNGTRPGAAYVFARTGTNWSQQAKLSASPAGAGDLFGLAVAIDGDTLIIGARYEDNGGANAGAAYMFVRNGTNWTQQAYLKAATPSGGELFGHAVALSGDTAVASAINENATYVFVRSGTNWTRQARLVSSNSTLAFGAAGDHFGRSVAITGDTIAVGASAEDSIATGINGNGANDSSPDSGAAYIFVRSGTNWTQQAYIKPAAVGTTQAGDLFGYSVALTEDALIVGAFLEDSSTTGINSAPNESATDAGAAYIFTRSGTNWSQKAYLKSGNSQTLDRFGLAVAVSGDTVLVGAYQEDSGTSGVNSTPNENGRDSGAAYLFTGLIEIGVSGNSLSIAPDDTTPSLADHTDFGYSLLAGGMVTRTFTITNHGIASLHLGGSPKIGVSGLAPGDFAVTAEPAATVAPGSNTTFQITFDPTAPGVRMATLSITNDDSASRIYGFALQGFGNQPPVASALEFGIDQGGTNSFAVIGGKYDPTDADGHLVTVSAVQTPSVTGAAGISTDGTNILLNYTAVGSFTGTDTFSYTVSDGVGGTDTKLVTVTVRAGGVGANIAVNTIVVSGAQVSLQAQGIIGATYRLQFTPSLSPVAWEDLTGSDTVASATGGLSFNHTHTSTFPANGFFRTKYVSGP